MEENEETKESKKDKILLASIAVILILSLIVTNVEFEFSEMYTYIDSVPRQTTEIYEKSVSKRSREYLKISFLAFEAAFM